MVRMPESVTGSRRHELMRDTMVDAQPRASGGMETRRMTMLSLKREASVAQGSKKLLSEPSRPKTIYRVSDVGW